jgi:hypothetical protein
MLSIFDRTRVMANYRVGRSMINGEMRQHFVDRGVEPGRVEKLRGRPVETRKLQDMGGMHEEFGPEERSSKNHRLDTGRREDNRRDEGR